MRWSDSRLVNAAGWIVGAGAALFILGSLASSIYLQRSFLKPKRKKNLTSNLEGFIPEAVYTTTPLQIRSMDGLRISSVILTPESPNGHGIVVCHGLAHDKNSGIRFVQYLLNAGYTLLLLDFRNHGESDGNMTTYGYFEKYDLLAAIQHVRESLGPSARIGILGASMGASIALMAAAETDDVQALVLDSPFASLKSISSEWAGQITRLPRFLLLLPLQMAYLWVLLQAGFPIPAVEPWRKAMSIKCPLFLIHGGADQLIGPHHSRQIYENAAGEKELWIHEEAGHLGVYLVNTQEYQRRVLHFFRRNLLGPV